MKSIANKLQNPPYDAIWLEFSDRAYKNMGMMMFVMFECGDCWEFISYDNQLRSAFFISGYIPLVNHYETNHI